MRGDWLFAGAAEERARVQVPVAGLVVSVKARLKRARRQRRRANRVAWDAAMQRCSDAATAAYNEARREMIVGETEAFLLTPEGFVE